MISQKIFPALEMRLFQQNRNRPLGGVVTTCPHGSSEGDVELMEPLPAWDGTIKQLHLLPVWENKAAVHISDVFLSLFPVILYAKTYSNIFLY